MERDPERVPAPAAQAAVLVAAQVAVEAEAGVQDREANASVLSAAPGFRTSPARPVPLYPARSAARS